MKQKRIYTIKAYNQEGEVVYEMWQVPEVDIQRNAEKIAEWNFVDRVVLVETTPIEEPPQSPNIEDWEKIWKEYREMDKGFIIGERETDANSFTTLGSLIVRKDDCPVAVYYKAGGFFTIVGKLPYGPYLWAVEYYLTDGKHLESGSVDDSKLAGEGT